MSKDANKENDMQQTSAGDDNGGIFTGYKGGVEMPLAGYAGLLGAFNAGVTGLLLAAENSKRPVDGRGGERVALGDLLLLGVATHKLSRVIASDRVTAPLRAPFVEYEKPAGTSEVKEHVRGTGAQRAMGDLLTCPYCLSPWVAAALAAGMIFRPRATRILSGIFAVATISDLLHSAQDTAKKSEKEPSSKDEKQ